MRSDPRTRVGAAVALAGLVLVSVLAACSGSPDTAEVDDNPAPRPQVTSTAYVPTTVRVNYHTDLIVFVSPTAGSDQLRGIEQVVQGLDVQSALLITSDRAYDEAKCLLAGRSGVLDTLPPELVGPQFRLDFGGDQAKILAAQLQLQNVNGVMEVTGGESALGGPGAAGAAGATGASGAAGAALPSSSTSLGPTATAVAPTPCQAEGIRVK